MFGDFVARWRACQSKKHIKKHSVLDFHLTAATHLCNIVVVTPASFWLMLKSQARVSSGFIRNPAGNILSPLKPIRSPLYRSKTAEKIEPDQ